MDWFKLIFQAVLGFSCWATFFLLAVLPYQSWHRKDKSDAFLITFHKLPFLQHETRQVCSTRLGRAAIAEAVLQVWAQYLTECVGSSSFLFPKEVPNVFGEDILKELSSCSLAGVFIYHFDPSAGKSLVLHGCICERCTCSILFLFSAVKSHGLVRQFTRLFEMWHIPSTMPRNMQSVSKKSLTSAIRRVFFDPVRPVQCLNIGRSLWNSHFKPLYLLKVTFTLIVFLICL